MPTEGADWISELDPAQPTGADPVSEGDDEFQQLKRVLRTQFPAIEAETAPNPVLVTAAQLNDTARRSEDHNFGNSEIISGEWEWSQPLLIDAGATMLNGAPLSGKTVGGAIRTLVVMAANDLAALGNTTSDTEILANTEIFMRRLVTCLQGLTVGLTLDVTGIATFSAAVIANDDATVNGNMIFGAGTEMRYGNIIAAGATGVSARKVEIFNAAGVSQGFMAIFPL